MTDLPPALAKLGHHTSVATVAALRELAALAPSADQLAEWAMVLADRESRFSDYDEIVVEVDLRGLRINLSALEPAIARVQRIAARDVALQCALDAKEAEIREWAVKHNPNCECEVESTWLEAIAWFRGLSREAS